MYNEKPSNFYINTYIRLKAPKFLWRNFAFIKKLDNIY